jgi:peptide/nickel transport system substrate-binding protein
LFSYERATSETSDVTSWFAPVERVRVVDDYTIDFITTNPNPLFPDSIANFMIVSREWAEANRAETPASQAENHATRNANGTGPFVLSSRSPGVETRLVPNRQWWDEAEHNLTEAIYTPIENQSTALSALLSGEIDLISPVPLQDVRRVESQPGFKVLSGLETRVIMLGFGHEKDRLDYSDDVRGENPFQDRRVRQAVYQAIDVATINRVIMRNAAEPASQLLPEGLSGYSEEHDERFPYDPAAARRLLRQAGYPNGFSFGLMCPNDRYLNDEQVCRAVTSMLAEVGLDAELTTMPVRNYWGELREDNYDMYLLGWSPGTFDHEHPIRFLVHTPDPEARLGSWNYGGFSNERVDELLPQIQSELDPEERQEMIDEVVEIYQEEVAYVPLYTQPLIWAMKSDIEVVQRPDNFFMLRWVTVN